MLKGGASSLRKCQHHSDPLQFLRAIAARTRPYHRSDHARQLLLVTRDRAMLTYAEVGPMQAIRARGVVSGPAPVSLIPCSASFARVSLVIPISSGTFSPFLVRSSRRSDRDDGGSRTPPSLPVRHAEAQGIGSISRSLCIRDLYGHVPERRFSDARSSRERSVESSPCFSEIELSSAHLSPSPRPAGGIIADVRRTKVFDHGVMGVSLPATRCDLWWGLSGSTRLGQLGWTTVSEQLSANFVEPVTGFS